MFLRNVGYYYSTWCSCSRLPFDHERRLDVLLVRNIVPLKWPTLRAFLVVNSDDESLTTVSELLYAYSRILITSDHSHKHDLWHLTRKDIKMGTVRLMMV